METKPDNSAPDNLEFRSEEVQEVLSAVPNWMIRWGNVVFLLIIFLIIALSYFIKYPDIIETETVITTEIPPQKEFARLTGKIDSIYVIDAQTVFKNTVLGVIENNANAEDVYFLKSILDTVKLKDGDLHFPFTQLPILVLGDIEESFAQFENNYNQYLLNIELKPFLSNERANRISLSELNRRLLSLNAQLDLNESEIKLKKNELERNQILYKKGVISKQEFENIQLEVLTAKRNLKNLTLSISQIREEVSEGRQLLKATKFSRAKGETQLIRNTIQSINKLRKVIGEWEDKYVLKSEIYGQVSFMNIWNENQTVQDGDLVFTIIPIKFSRYVAKVKAPLLNSGKIQIGQKVNIKLENYPEAEFGIIRGKVEKISLTANKDDFYIIDVSLPESLITSYGKEISFKQEMRGTAEIITDDLRLLERVLYQFKKLMNQ